MQSELDAQAGSTWNQLSPLLDEAMLRLGQTDRDALVLRFFEGRSLNEVGHALGASEEAAKKRVNRALDKLRNLFAKRGVDSTTAIIAETISAHSVQAAPVALAKAATAAAITKGAAASTSTLNLIKGALKIMAWTKAKTAIIVGASVLLAAGTTTVTIKAIAAHRVDESWRVPNPDHDNAPFLVEILPTKFPDSVDSLNSGSRGDNWIGIGRRVRDIAGIAYGWRTGRILFADTEPTDRYDFISTLPQGSAAALQAELKRKLGFVGHREMRDMDVLVLKVRRSNAPGLKPPIDGRNDGCSRGRYHCDNAPLYSDSAHFPGITRFLEGYFEMPVIDQTGLTQNYHIDLKWNERWGQDPNHDALKQVLLDQLGLELVPSNMPVEMLVVERVKD
jgi:uncharacterized protein (TIGR03435 family)